MENHIISIDNQHKKIMGQASFENSLENYIINLGAEDFGRKQIFSGNSAWDDISKNLENLPRDIRLIRVHNYGLREGFIQTILCSMNVNYKRSLGEIRLKNFKNEELYQKLKTDLQNFVSNWSYV